MTFLQFAAFAAVAKQLNITKAAHELHTSQPYLSKQLKILEESYRTKLFTRYSKGVELTEDGIEFLGLIKPIFEQLQLLEARFPKRSQIEAAVPLNVGATHQL